MIIRRIFLAFLLLVIFLPTLAFADSNIVAIVFEGLASVPESTVRRLINSHEGSPYDAGVVSEDIHKIYQAGLFGNVEARTEPVKGGVKLIFRISENQVVGKLTLKGNKKLKEDDLQTALRIRENDVLDPARIAETKREIYSLYEEKGYYLADITTEINPFDEEKNEVELVLSMDEGESVKIRRISFVGNREISDKKLRKKMKTKEKGFLSFISSSGKFRDEVLEVDLQRLRFFYLDEGFLRAKVGTPNVTLARNKRSIIISVPVVEGERYDVANIDIQGDVLTTREEILSKLSLKTGKMYRKSLEVEDIQTLERIYGDQAYAFANIYPQVIADDQSKTAQVTYVVDKGPKIKVNRILIKGNRITRDKVIRREMRIFENADFSRSGIDNSRARLMQLGYFDDINISTPRAGSGDNQVDVVVDVKERENTGQFSVGAGFSTLENFILTASVQKENFFGRGWSGGVSADVSKLKQNFSIYMTDRYFLDTRWQFSFSVFKYNSALNRFFNQNRTGGSVKFGREIFDYFSILAGYQLEDVNANNFAAQVPAFFQNNSGGITSALTAQAIYDRRDNRLATTRGVFLMANVDYSDDFLGANNNFVRTQGDARVYFPLPFSMVIKSHGQISYIKSIDNNPVGLFNRFFLGGPTTLRGYNLNSVGPSLRVPTAATGGDTSFVYGGNKMLMFNTELEIPIYKPAGFQAVAFFDAGNAYAETENFDVMDLRMNYGFGLRWSSPFGPLRFEWGFPIDKRQGEAAAVFNFTIGQSF